MNFLSGKKLRLVFFGLILVAIIGFLASQPDNLRYGNNDTLLNSDSDRNAQIKALGSINKRDSDNDGLKDWEEELWGTDSKNPDTDGDGTKDGEEVDLGRNPTIAGPDDEYQGDVFVKQNLQDFSNDLTATEKFSQEFFQEYLSLKQSGTSFDSEDAQDFFLNSVLEKMEIDGGIKIYTLADVNIVDDSSKEAIRTYGNTMGSIIVKYSIENENEAVILKRALETSNQKELEKLYPIITAYENHISDFLIVPVPQNMADIHLALINSFSEITDTIERMRVVFTDPLMALNKIALYQENVDEMFRAFQDINKYFQTHGIIFNDNETGYVFTHMVI